MPKRIKVPQYAKEQAKRGLKEREKNKAGLTKSVAKVYNIQSGVERAKEIISKEHLKETTLKQIARFYLRFRNCRTERCETALKLWGGRRFGRHLVNIYYK